jgi:hypothetical protein
MAFLLARIVSHLQWCINYLPKFGQLDKAQKLKGQLENKLQQPTIEFGLLDHNKSPTGNVGIMLRRS